MTDFEILKKTFKDIGCNYLSTQTLIGVTIIVPINNSKEVHYEFDTQGNFIRVI